MGEEVREYLSWEGKVKVDKVKRHCIHQKQCDVYTDRVLVSLKRRNGMTFLSNFLEHEMEILNGRYIKIIIEIEEEEEAVK